jgi:AcrR family transcriptional regulator
MARRSSPETRLADALLRALAKRSWRDISLASVAKAAKVPMKDLSHFASTKPALIGLLLRRFGDEVASQYRPSRQAGATHDRLFDVGMAWFDGLAQHKPAIRSLYKGLKSDPLALFVSRGAILGTAEWLMALAEADKGPALALRAAGYAAILGRAVPVWLDDNAEMTKTMARLDGDLRRAGGIFGPKAK